MSATHLASKPSSHDMTLNEIDENQNATTAPLPKVIMRVMFLT